MEPEIAPQDLDRVQATVVDVRTHEEHAEGSIPGDVHIPLDELQQRAGELSDPVVFYCQSGDRSTMAAQAFRASGREAASLTGGFAAWSSAKS